jgi:hypothetical protein
MQNAAIAGFLGKLEVHTFLLYSSYIGTKKNLLENYQQAFTFLKT